MFERDEQSNLDRCRHKHAASTPPAEQAQLDASSRSNDLQGSCSGRKWMRRSCDCTGHPTNSTASTTLQAEHAQQDASSRGDDLNDELQRRIKEAAVLRVQLDASSTKAVAMESQLKESVAVSDGCSCAAALATKSRLKQSVAAMLGVADCSTVL